MDDRFPKITQQPRERGESYICNMRSGATAGFKYFDIKALRAVSVRTMGYATGKLRIMTEPDGEARGEIEIGYANVWADHSAPVSIPDGVHALYFRFEGNGFLQFASFRLIVE